ncbi:ribonuclease H2 subunit C [Pararge aegeria]|uniref:ribonuclease H2 subunit C n=1 Tax=Pararge aegeria TaxID=116150 RepID=UPI0019D2CD48|nr:ribonuclease H2 subunit C [Pararge aegeria]
MSIKVENNLKERKDDKIFEQKAHYIPCQVEEDGPANVSEYFEPYVVDNGNGELSATFRGHPMDGVKMSLPDGYRAVIVEEGKRPLSEDAERKFQVSGGFKEIIYWNWDKKPSRNDNLAKSLVWMDIAEAIHGD